MKNRLVAELVFSSAFRSSVGTSSFIAEAHLNGQVSGPWSMRCEPWSLPDDLGVVLAWVSFLSADVPFGELPLGESFALKLGRDELARVTLKVYPQISTTYRESDFVSNPNAPVRDMAA